MIIRADLLMIRSRPVPTYGPRGRIYDKNTLGAVGHSFIIFSRLYFIVCVLWIGYKEVKGKYKKKGFEEYQ